MNSRNQLLLGILVACTVPVGVASATLPGNQTAAFLMHETPSDSLSPVTFTVDLDLKAVDMVGSDVAWQVASISLTQAGVGGNQDTVWIEYLPIVSTTDGLWWITHTDPLIPDNAEFSVPPYLSGTATCVDSSIDDLNYFLEGWTYQPPSEGAPYPITASLDYQMILVSASVAKAQAVDEPVEMPDVPPDSQ